MVDPLRNYIGRVGDISNPLKNTGGDSYRLVAVSKARAVVLLDDPDADDLEIVITAEGGDIMVVEKGLIDTLVGAAKSALSAGAKLAKAIGVGCKKVNKQEVKFDSNGNVSSVTNVQVIECKAGT